MASDKEIITAAHKIKEEAYLVGLRDGYHAAVTISRWWGENDHLVEPKPKSLLLEWTNDKLQGIRQKIFKNDPFQLDMQTKMDIIRE